MNAACSATLTFLVTDLCGSTASWEADPEAMRAALTRHDSLISAAVVSEGGRVFKTVGDGACAAFATAAAAIRAGIAIQDALAKEQWERVEPLLIRIAIHSGAAHLRDCDYFGPTVNRVARLLGIAHGGQTLVSHSTFELIRDDVPSQIELRDLGEHRLRDLARPEHVHEVVIPELNRTFPPLRSLDYVPNNLPHQLSSFVGRDREIGALKQLLREVRLITLTGPGGTGKTRLSLQVAAEVLEDFDNGVWLAELAALSDPASVWPAVASAVGVKQMQSEPIERTLTLALRDRELLLLIDNCEHLVEPCARVVDHLLGHCPKLRVISTSREALGVPGEHSFPVPGLTLPGSLQQPSIEVLNQCESMKLFVERAYSVAGEFSLTRDNADCVAEICNKLDGIPLAIELAAARVRAMGVEQIARRLADRFRLLNVGSRTAAPRQQTLRATIDWSYDLLSEPERLLLRRLSIFAGGWVLDAAELVCAGEGIEADAVVHALTRLVDRSLVVRHDQTRNPRYDMLETIRIYSEEQALKQSEGVRELRLKHLHWLTHLVEMDVQSRQDVSVESMQRTESYVAERENIRIAMKFALSDPATIDDAVALAAGVYDTWRSRVNHAEGLQWLKSALALEGWSHSDRRACALCRLLAGCSLVGDPAGLVYAEEGLHLCKHCKRAEEAVDICCFAALLAVSVGRTDECDKLLSEADQLTARGNTDDSMLLMTRGEIDRMRGKLQSARERNLEALKRLRRLGSQRGTAARINLAILDTQLGNLDQARRWSYDALDIAVARWHFGHLSGVFDAIALRAMSLNRSRDAAHLMGQAEQLRRDHCTPIPLADREFVEELRARICEALGDGAQQAFETGSRLPLEDAIALSRSI